MVIDVLLIVVGIIAYVKLLTNFVYYHVHETNLCTKRDKSVKIGYAGTVYLKEYFHPLLHQNLYILV